VRSCCDTTGCWYTADGAKFPCDGFDCYAAAEDVVNHCKPRSSSSSSSSSDDDTDESSGCTMASGHSSGTLGAYLALGAVASLAWRRRRKQG
jgi:MYXO-CTERM domain-containing protein